MIFWHLADAIVYCLGEIPATLGQLIMLTMLDLQNNQLSGKYTVGSDGVPSYQQ